MKKLTIGITGASGSILAQRLISFLIESDIYLSLVISENGRRVFEYETGHPFHTWIHSVTHRYLTVYDDNNLFAPIASGSAPSDGMIIIPCSMSTVGRLATGSGTGLLCRAADVCLKERRPLVVLPRETPLSTIHLRNLLTLSENGAVILPPVPMFYSRAETPEKIVDEIVGRALQSLHVENLLFTNWGEKI